MMPLVYYVQTLLTGLLILAIIFVDILKHRQHRLDNQGLFIALLASNALLLLFELFLNLSSGSAHAASRFMITAIVFIFYSLNPVPGALWFLYLANLLRRRSRLPFGQVAAISIPAVLNLVFSLASLFGPGVFMIDQNNIYRRGPLFWIMVAITYGYPLASLIYLISRLKVVRMRELVSLGFFSLLPILGGAIQVLFFGISVVWLGLSLALLIIYMGIQSQQIFTDYLTGLANRRRFDRHLGFLCSASRPKGRVAGLMIDVNSFKSINDEYGHDLGDRALSAVAAIIKDSLRWEDLVARFGGDEFAALLVVDDYDALLSAVGSIRSTLESFNATSKLPFALSLSIGSALYDPGEDASPAAFLSRLDALMYDEKDRYRASRPRFGC